MHRLNPALARQPVVDADVHHLCVAINEALLPANPIGLVTAESFRMKSPCSCNVLFLHPCSSIRGLAARNGGTLHRVTRISSTRRSSHASGDSSTGSAAGLLHVSRPLLSQKT